MKKTQNYSNHTRYYVPHHFIFYPVIAILFTISVIRSFTSSTHAKEWMMFAAVVGLIAWLAFMMRQHYALTTQNRIVRLEMRFRYYRLTQEDFERIETHLSFGQIAALRFAPDEELIPLIQRAVNENLSPDLIKKSIAKWVPDYMRV
jgi:hypothetical protein